MRKFSSLLVFLGLFLVMGGTALAEQHDRLLPFLKSFDGWQAKPARGSSMVSAQMRMISASRNYSKADKTMIIDIMVNSGPVLESDLEESSSDSGGLLAKTRRIDGFWIKTTYTKKSASCQVIVYLDYNQEASGMLIVDFTKMGEDEALRIVKELDCQKIKKVISTML